MQFDKACIFEASTKHLYVKLWGLEVLLAPSMGKDERLVVSVPTATWRV